MAGRRPSGESPARRPLAIPSHTTSAAAAGLSGEGWGGGVDDDLMFIIANLSDVRYHRIVLYFARSRQR